MTDKHTPGPWAERNGRIFQTDREELTIANVARAFDGDYSPANARLIASAPDLLSALKGLQEIVKAALDSGVWVVDGSCDPDAQMIRAEKAIEKATGVTKE